MERSDWCQSHSGGATFCCIDFPQTLFLRVEGSGAARLTHNIITTWIVKSEETWTAKRQLWKLGKTLDRVEQAEPQADHIIIVIIAVFTYRL